MHRTSKYVSTLRTRTEEEKPILYRDCAYSPAEKMALRWTLYDADGVRPDDDNHGRVVHSREGSDGAGAALTLSQGEFLSLNPFP